MPARIKATAKAQTGTPTALSFTATATLDFEAKAADGTPRRPTFSIKGYTGAPMQVSGFYSPVIVDLAGLKASRDKIPILLDHDPGRIVGQTDGITIDASGVTLTGIVTGEDASSASVISHARNGFEWQASIGASIVRQEFLKAGATAVVNGRDVTGPLLIARESRLYETSFVAVGADQQTTAAVAAKSASLDSTKGVNPMFQEWLEAKGIDPAALDDPTRKYLQSSFDGEQAAAKQAKADANDSKALATRATQSLDEIVATRRKEDDRLAQITKIAADAMDDRPLMRDEIQKMAQIAIEAKSTPAEFELPLMRAMRHRPAGSTSAFRGDGANGRKLLTATICRGGRLQGIEKAFDQQTLNASEDRFPHGFGLRDLLIMAARENGFSGPSTNDVRGLLQAAFSPGNMIRANDGFSTLSLPGILSDVANKFLVSAFNAVETGWREIAAIRSVRDFRTNHIYSLTGGMTYEKVPPAGELKHAVLGETSYTIRAETFGRIFAITRQDIINDDLNALTQVPTRLGRGAALGLNLAFWTEFLADANTFWTAGQGNVITGGTSTLTSEGLRLATLKFSKQTDPDGNPLGLTPRILVVPPELEITANELMTSLIINTGGASTETKVPNRNVWANKYVVVVSTYLSNSNLTGNSSAAWYLIASPDDLPLIEVAFLNGRETPIVESADADFNTLGIQFRGYHDWGVSKMEPRAGIRAAGS